MDAPLHDLRAALRSLLRTPSLVLAAAASVLGLVFASWAIDMLRAAMPASIARYAAGWDDFALDGRFYAFGAVAAACSAVAAGLLPSVRVSNQDVHATLALRRAIRSSWAASASSSSSWRRRRAGCRRGARRAWTRPSPCGRSDA